MDIQLNKIKVQLPDGRKLFEIRQVEFKSGSHTLITGASGRGKSTLLHLISGLFLPAEGHVNVGAHEMARLSDSERSHIRRTSFGIVFQKLNLIDHMTSLENILLARRQSDDTTPYLNRAEAALQALGIASVKNQMTAKLSLGEQQRVAVARVLASKPPIILADEPTSSLDDENAAIVIRHLKQAAKNQTLIVVSHDHRIWDAFSNRVEFDKLNSYSAKAEAKS